MISEGLEKRWLYVDSAPITRTEDAGHGGLYSTEQGILDKPGLQPSTCRISRSHDTRIARCSLFRHHLSGEFDMLFGAVELT